jgi:hypothetical protein
VRVGAATNNGFFAPGAEKAKIVESKSVAAAFK